MKRFILAALLAIQIINIPISEAHAGGISKDLQNFFDATGNSSNVTSGGAFQGQRGGHFTGGSIYTRGNIKNTEIFNIQPPQIKTGCGAIDMYTGGFSHINSKQMVDTFKSIGSNSASFAFSIALQTMTPQIKGVVDELYNISQEVNGMNINSCGMAAQLVGGALPKTQATHEVLCRNIGMQQGFFKDYADANQQCSSQAKADEMLSRKSYKDKFGDLLGNEFNLVWKALNKNRFLSNDKDLAEFFMSITGSIIVRKDSSAKEKKSYITEHLQSLYKNKDIIDALLDGGRSVEIYRCERDDTDCLRPVKREIVLSKDTSLITKVEKMMIELVRKVREEGSIAEKNSKEKNYLTQEEKNFIESTSLPIFKILAVQLAFKENTANIGATELADAIAHDILLNYMEEILEITEKSLLAISHYQFDDSKISEMREEIRLAKKDISDKRFSAYQRMEAILSATSRTRQIETQLYDKYDGTNKVRDE